MPSHSVEAQEALLAAEPLFLLQPTSLLVTLQPEGVAPAAQPHLGEALWADLLAAALSTSWPERRLAWQPASCCPMADPPCLLLAATLLAARDSEPAADALLRRLQAQVGHAVCELTAPCWPAPSPLLPLPAAELAGEGQAAQLAVLRAAGLVLLPPLSALQPSEQAFALALVRRRLAATEAALERQRLRPFVDDFACNDAASRDRGRIELRLPVGGDSADGDAKRLAALATDAPWVSLVRAALSDAAPSCTVSAVVSRPGAVAQQWHADGPHPAADAARAYPPTASSEPPAFSPPARPNAVCVFVALGAVDAAQGGTHFWLGSHCASGLVEAAAVTLPVVQGSAAVLRGLEGTPPGTALLYDYRLVHRGAANRSRSERPLLQFVYRSARGAWEEGHNFGSAPLLPTSAWTLTLPPGEGGADAALEGEQGPAKRARAESLAGWSVFD